jgi:hypothetical protein
MHLCERVQNADTVLKYYQNDEYASMKANALLSISLFQMDTELKEVTRGCYTSAPADIRVQDREYSTI